MTNQPMVPDKCSWIWDICGAFQVFNFSFELYEYVMKGKLRN